MQVSLEIIKQHWRFCERLWMFSTDMFTNHHWVQRTRISHFTPQHQVSRSRKNAFGKLLNCDHVTFEFNVEYHSRAQVPTPTSLAAMTSEPSIVVTGYGPFGPHTRNTSWQAVKIVKEPYSKIVWIRSSAKRWRLGCAIPRPGTLWLRGRVSAT